jgi:hypothetical protein
MRRTKTLLKPPGSATTPSKLANVPTKPANSPTKKPERRQPLWRKPANRKNALMTTHVAPIPPLQKPVDRRDSRMDVSS